MIVLAILGILAGVIGIIGSLFPGIPGPPLSWAGLLLMYFYGKSGNGDPISTRLLLIWLAIVIVVAIVGYIIPSYTTKLTGGSKYASRGAIIGLFAGIFIPPIGMIVGSLLGAFLADFIFDDKGVWKSFKASIGAFVGFMCTTGINIICSGLMMYYMIVAL